jgi:cytidylate kinase
MVVAIDGPAGAGKSSVAKNVANKTGMFYLNSGNFYRAITFEVLRGKIDPEDTEAIIECAKNCTITLIDGDIHLNGENVEDQLHTDAVDRWVSEHSAIIPVRHIVNRMLRNVATHMDLIVEGRDISTVVFPDAEVKVYLDASIEVRAQRRFQQGVSTLTIEKIRENIQKRDTLDKNKEEGSLQKASDALYIDTSDLTIDEVCDRVILLIKNKPKKN